MSITEKNKRFLNPAPSSQWKIVPQPDEEDEDVVNSATNRIGQENRSFGDTAEPRPLRDVTAFYRNDTSRFLGELQKAETQLYKNVSQACQIDFFPSRRKTSRKEGEHETQRHSVDDFLSNSDGNTVPLLKNKKRKNEEPEKLIVDVNDFVDSFSTIREPVYLKGVSRKNQPEPEPKSEVEHLLDQVQLRRDNSRSCETLGQESKSAEYIVPDKNAVDINAETRATISDCPILGEDILPLKDGVTRDAAIHHQTTIADACEVCLDTASGISTSKVSNEPEYSSHLVVSTLTILPQNEVRNFQKHDAFCHVDEQAARVTATPVKVEMKAKTVAPDSHDDESSDPIAGHKSDNEIVTNDRMDDRLNEVAVTESKARPTQVSCPEVSKFSEILERMEKFAGNQCDSLADYIKNKVYDGSRLIAFCGMKRGAGCSTMTLLAARGITRHGLKTAVIDANFEFPRLHAMVTGQDNLRENQASWVNILHGAVDWETVGITPKDMSLLTLFPLAENSLVNWSQFEPERLQQETNRLVSVFQEYFDLILLDCGCFEEAFEEITWGELALFQPDGVILVRNPNNTPLELLEPCCREILSGGIGAYGVAENFV